MKIYCSVENCLEDGLITLLPSTHKKLVIKTLPPLKKTILACSKPFPSNSDEILEFEGLVWMYQAQTERIFIANTPIEI